MRSYLVVGIFVVLGLAWLGRCLGLWLELELELQRDVEASMIGFEVLTCLLSLLAYLACLLARFFNLWTGGSVS